MVFVAFFKQKTVIGNSVHVNKLYQQYSTSRIDEVGEVTSPTGVDNTGTGAPLADIITVPDARSAAGKVANPEDVLDAAVVHDGGAPTAAGEVANSADVVNAAAGAPSGVIISLLDGGATAAADATGTATGPTGAAATSHGDVSCICSLAVLLCFSI
jgi:hypothetical protein